MEELAKAITELIRAGAPLGEMAIRWYFFVQIIGYVGSLFIACAVLGTACFFLVRCLRYFHWLRTCEMESQAKTGQPYETPRHDY